MFSQSVGPHSSHEHTGRPTCGLMVGQGLKHEHYAGHGICALTGSHNAGWEVRCEQGHGGAESISPSPIVPTLTWPWHWLLWLLVPSSPVRSLILNICSSSSTHSNMADDKAWWKEATFQAQTSFLKAHMATGLSMENSSRELLSQRLHSREERTFWNHTVGRK